MPILPEIAEKIQQKVLPLVRPKWQPRVLLGINALSLQPFVSLNANARASRENTDAAQRQLYRLLAQPDLVGLFASLLLAFFSIDEQSVIAMDFTIEGKFAMLCLALQTREGRAIPIWVDVLEYPVNDHSQNLFILDVVREFQAVVGCSFKLVCDRGFIGEWLIGGFLDLELKFYVRLKRGQHWLVEGKRRCLKKQGKLDQIGVIYGENLRIVRSSKTLQRQRKAKEPWVILTNDVHATRDQILEWYAHRFEIEETFKDLKHLLNFIPTWFKKRRSVLTVFWFAILGFWLLWQVSRNPMIWQKWFFQAVQKKLSWMKHVFELLQKELKQLVFPEFPSRREVILP
jgi:hypothetical protein